MTKRILWFFIAFVVAFILYVLFLALFSHIDYVGSLREVKTGKCVTTSVGSGNVFKRTENIPDGYIKDPNCNL
jgi:hypothetical protein